MYYEQGGTLVFGNGCEEEVTNAINTFIREEMRREETHREPSRRKADLFATFRSFVDGGEFKVLPTPDRVFYSGLMLTHSKTSALSVFMTAPNQKGTPGHRSLVSVRRQGP